MIAAPDLAHILPQPFEWCFIPGGEVTVQVDRQILEEIEESDDGFRTRFVEDFAMAKYPITHAQFQVFIDASDGYFNPQWWVHSPESTAWQAAHPHKPYPQEQFTNNHPRVWMNLYEAIAFCNWLSSKVDLPNGMSITIPTEFQWQRAAQGNDNREYPWGETFDPAKTNTFNFGTGLNQITPVDHYPEGASPYGVMDMGGNTTEWTQTLYRLHQEVHSVIVKGGSYKNNPLFTRCIGRQWGFAHSRHDINSVRIVYCNASEIEKHYLKPLDDN